MRILTVERGLAPRASRARSGVGRAGAVFGCLAVAVLGAACRAADLPTASLPDTTPVRASSLSPTPTPQLKQSSPGLQAAIASALPEDPGRLGMYVEHLGTQEQASIAPEEVLRSASLYKLFVLYAAYGAIQRGELRPDEVLTASPRAIEAEPYAEWGPGAQAMVSEALELMISSSHNAAAAVVVERLGGPGPVTAEIQRAGLRQTEITGSTAFTSAADVASVLKAIATERAVSPPASQEMLQLLLEQEQRDRLPLPLPYGVEVAHKTGELPHLRHDAGIVYAPSGPYVFVALVDDAPSDGSAQETIVAVSRAVYRYLEGIDE
jgi:beta-lactamase class A